MVRGRRARHAVAMKTGHGHHTTEQPGAGTTPETPARRLDGPRRLRRSRGDRMIAGVCGGIAEHFDLDPAVVRIATVTLVFAGGVGIVPYVAAWILMPSEDEAPATISRAQRPAHRRGRTDARRARGGR